MATGPSIYPANQRPQPLTVEEYRRRQKKPSLPTEEATQHTKKKRRGGVIQKLKREKAILQRLINHHTPPSWIEASRMWLKIDEINFLINQELQRRKKH